ncbi:L-aspartate oxidase [Candidatus Roizmanbacteria bacterium]|nr:L-aspartate oxidase [Candidatus Roizmanbacteria bacterium]
MQKKIDFIVVGSGIAGLNTALTLASFGKVLIITKKKLNASSTFFAQGGIAAVTKKDDSLNSHFNDTLAAGYHHNKKQAVDFLVKNGSNAIEKLVKFGIQFDKQDGDYVTSFEAAHSYPRILHATDITGQEISNTLIANVLNNSNIKIWENTQAIDLISKNNICYGVQVLRRNKIINLFSRAVILATGGAGQLFQWTTNPAVATADGIAIAARAKVTLSDLEFVQFHPTALKGKTAQLFLLSEALRGEGAYLIDSKGHRFMPDLHPLAELAPRDVVARAIFQKQKAGEVYLDLRHKDPDFVLKRFPKISTELKKRGFDLTCDLIPVIPAAHFMCGGITTDLYGKTSMANLFAYGEVAATGVHGANRLASNSLLEGIVFSSQIEKCLDEIPSLSVIARSETTWRSLLTQKPFTRLPRSFVAHNDNKKLYNIKNQLKKIMWNYVGIERTSKGLSIAQKKLKLLKNELYFKNQINSEILEIENMLDATLAITHSALNREQSLGAHYLLK